MQPNPIVRAIDSWQRSSYPLTIAFIAITVLTFLASMSASAAQWLAQNLGFLAPSSLSRPWALLTYALLTLFPNIIGLLFNGLALWWFGGSLERAWGTRTYAIFCALISAVTAVSMSLGAFMLQSSFAVNQWLPGAALIVAWCMLNPMQEIRLYGIIPILAKWLALGEVLIIFFLHAAMHPLLGMLSLAGCATAYAWAKSRKWSNAPFYPLNATAPRYAERDWSTPSAQPKPKMRRPTPPLDDRRTLRDLNPLEWIARRRRRKQFERLMKDD